MSWQGNENLVSITGLIDGDMEEAMLGYLSELLYMYGDHGNGWYLLGNFFEDCGEEDDYDQPDWGKGWDYAWLPNPFMKPGVLAMRVRCPHDLMEAAFECWDTNYDAIAYAGDGDEPLERVTVYGKVYDMRAA